MEEEAGASCSALTRSENIWAQMTDGEKSLGIRTVDGLLRDDSYNNWIMKNPFATRKFPDSTET